MFWSKSQEKGASDPEPEPSGPDSTTPEPSNAPEATTKDAPTPEEEEEIASAPSESVWGSRLTTAKQLYGTANQLYTVAQAIPQAKAALEPYLTKASTAEDPTSKQELATKPVSSTQEVPESTTEPAKKSQTNKLTSYTDNVAPDSEAPLQPRGESKIEENTPSPSSERSTEGEESHEDAAIENTPASQDSPTSKSVSSLETQDEQPTTVISPGPSESMSLEAEPSNIDTDLKDLSSTLPKSGQADGETTEDLSVQDSASQDISGLEDTKFVPSRSTAEDEAPDATKSLGSAEDKLLEEPIHQDADVINEPSNDTSASKDSPATPSVTEANEETPVASEKSLDLKGDAQSIGPIQEKPAATDTVSTSLKDPETKPRTQPETSPSISGPEVKEPTDLLPEDERPEPGVQTKAPSSSESSSTLQLDPKNTKHIRASEPVSVPSNDPTDAIGAVSASSVQHVAPAPSSQDTPAPQASLDPVDTDDVPSGPILMVPSIEPTPRSSSTEASAAAATPKLADEAPPTPASQQPTPEEIEKAADAAKAAARLQSTADTLWDQARAIRNPAEREKLWRAAYNKEVEAHGQSKKARAMASGWGQGLLSGVGISAAVGVGLGNVVGALLGGVVSVPGTLIGAGVGAAFGPLVKLGGGGGKDGKNKENERPKEFDWEEDLSDDEEHRQIVDAVRMHEATTQDKAKETS